MPNSTTQIATTAAPTAIAKSSKSTWYQVPANGRSTRMKSICWPPSRRRRGPGRLLQQPLPVPKGRLCGGLCLRLEHTVPHLPARQKAGRLLLIRCAPYASTGSRPVLNTEPTPMRPTRRLPPDRTAQSLRDRRGRPAAGSTGLRLPPDGRAILCEPRPRGLLVALHDLFSAFGAGRSSRQELRARASGPAGGGRFGKTKTAMRG